MISSSDELALKRFPILMCKLGVAMVEGRKGKGRDGKGRMAALSLRFRVGRDLLVDGKPGRRKTRSITGMNSDLSTDKERSLMGMDAG